VKRAGIFLTMMSVMVLVFAGVALAALIKGDDGPNTLEGTPRGCLRSPHVAPCASLLSISRIIVT
jgi:hypothetical protein